MRDLRRRALESSKTVSKKALSKQSSRVSSVENSRTASANVSEIDPDEDAQQDGDLSDSTSSSVHGTDDITFELPDDDFQAWKEDLKLVVEEITDRKRSGVEGREKSLASYNYIVSHRYAAAEIASKLHELVPALLKSVKKEGSEKETLLAIRALGLTTITCPENDLYESLSDPLKTAYKTSQSVAVKAAAIHARIYAAVYGGADEDSEMEIMDEYLEIIESDGHQIGASDGHEVVLAALEAWGFISTLCENFEDRSQEAIEVFVDQLESSFPNIQIAAGENIALLFERSWTETGNDEYDDSGSWIDPSKVPYIKRYDAYRQTAQLKHIFNQLLIERRRYIRKKEQVLIRKNFTDILQSIEDPTLGPRYQKALKKDDEEHGSKFALKIGDSGDGRTVRTIVINKWWRLIRLQGLRRLLGSGFLVHCLANEVVEESLPSVQREKSRTDTGGVRRKYELKEASVGISFETKMGLGFVDDRDES